MVCTVNYFVLARNQQLRQLGLPHDKQDDITFVKDYISKLEFDLLLLTEYFDEGLVLMKRKLCWSLRDILHVSHRNNSSTKSVNKTIVSIEEERRKIYQRWSSADYLLYHEANKTFWDQYSQYEDIQEETNHFKEVKNKVQNFCENNLFDYLQIFPNKDRIVHSKRLHSSETLTIPSSRWNGDFKVDPMFCVLLEMDDNIYRFTMKWVTLGTEPKKLGSKRSHFVKVTVFVSAIYIAKQQYRVAFNPFIFKV